MPRQPLLHELLVALAAPTQAWSGLDGQIRPEGAQGAYHGDLRVLSGAVLRVGGEEPEPIGAGGDGPGRVLAVHVARAVDGPGADPTVRVDRARVVTPGRVEETIVLGCATPQPVVTHVEVLLACDGASMAEVKSGGRPASLPARSAGTRAVRWDLSRGVRVLVDAPGAAVSVDGAAARLDWAVEVRAGRPVTLRWVLDVEDPTGVVRAPARAQPEWEVPAVDGDDRRLRRWLDQALGDLAGLRMTAEFAPDDVFLAAGAPWFFTLFGRDSLWAARMLLPLGTRLAGGTLRTLAARQGRRDDPGTAEQPGKILHEVRRGGLHLPAQGLSLPPVYYGTVDATPLWVCLLHDAWRWGMPSAEVAELLPAAERALAWMADFGDADGDGFLEYVDVTGTGLANQGWKDSGDSVQWRDGRLATGPIALAEVQGYAHEAALGGAALLDAFGRPGADRWRDWAARLRDRFREVFWVPGADGGYPGIALDADKRAVDTVTSNIGHLLGTGLLDAQEEALVAERLVRPDMSSGYGLRTMSTQSAGYWPLRYHGGAVWPHDTAVVLAGMARSGHAAAAATLADGLLAAADEFDGRLPELYAGDARGAVPRAVPYPAACRPQAWSAAACVAVLGAILGLDPDVPAGVLRVAPPRPSPVGSLQVHGLRLAGYRLDVDVSPDGAARVRTQAPVEVVAR